MSVRQRLVFLALACLCGGALAQAGAKPAAGTGKVSTLGEARPGSKLLTREELRACLGEQATFATRRTKVETERAGLDRERQELDQIDASLKSERAAIDKIAATVDSLNQRTKAHSQQVQEWNERNAKFQAGDASGPTADRQRNELERQRAALQSSAQALDSERAALVKDSEQTLKSYNARVTARDAAASDWNARNAKATQDARDFELDRETWSADCAGRPYREDDEIAIRAGK